MVEVGVTVGVTVNVGVGVMVGGTLVAVGMDTAGAHALIKMAIRVMMAKVYFIGILPGMICELIIS